MKLRRIIIFAILAVVAIGLAAPYIDAEGYRGRIKDALQRALGRQVDVGKVHFNLFTGPGFTVDAVTIHEDPSIGIEPFAYVESLEARIRLTSFWRRRLSFSNLRLSNPTVNIAKAPDGHWNFQMLLQRAASPGPATTGDFPSIQVRSGRISFKFGDYKSVFYLNDSDLDIDPIDRDRLDIRFSGQPSRTDQAAQYFGQLLGRGTWQRSATQEGRLDVNAELERSAISEVMKLIEGRSAGVAGIVASRAHISGPLSDLRITGDLELDDVHRWDLLPQKGGWRLKYRGKLDVWSQKLEVATEEKDNPGVPVKVRFEAENFLSDPAWSATAEFIDTPAADLIQAVRHMGAQLPDGLAVVGKAAGTISYSGRGGIAGHLSVRDSSVTIPGVVPLKFQTADVLIEGDHMTVGPSTIEAANGQTAELETTYGLATGALDLKISTKGLGISELQSDSGRMLGTAKIPILQDCRQGTWKGWARYQKQPDADGTWTGDFDLQNAKLNVAGVAEPLRIASAAVTLDGDRSSVAKIRGRFGDIHITGDYHHDPASPRGDRLKLEIAEAGLSDLEQVMMPTLSRPQGLLARFSLRKAPPPDWLRNRRLEGSVTIDKLVSGDQVWKVTSRLAWDGTSVKLTNLEASDGDAEAAGQISVDLAGAAPRYRMNGKIDDLEYKGGSLSLEAAVNARGIGVDLMTSARAKGTFAGTDIAFSPDAQFRNISGNFEWTPEARLQLTAIQAAQGLDVFSGQGSSQADGHVLLDLSTGRRQVHFTGALVAGIK